MFEKKIFVPNINENYLQDLRRTLETLNVTYERGYDSKKDRYWIKIKKQTVV
jgi:hypothetical protein